MLLLKKLRLNRLIVITKGLPTFKLDAITQKGLGCEMPDRKPQLFVLDNAQKTRLYENDQSELSQSPALPINFPHSPAACSYFRKTVK